MQTTYERDQQFISELLRDERNKIVEECIKIVETEVLGPKAKAACVAAMTALKDRP